ncbi:MAG: FtsK/SpoIIIE domain-containing protein [Eubacteriales bacterium]|nr:FtsK/SpoIIIE domain-containing protein [Eubacteriales bacterium]
MTKKLSKEDKQLEDLGNMVISIFTGIGKGVRNLKKDRHPLIILIVITLICGVVFYLRQEIANRFIPGDEDFHVLKVILMLMPALPLAILYMIGAEAKESQDEYEKKFAEINFCSKTKAYPKFIGKEVTAKEVKYTFYSVGLDLEDWRTYKSKLEQTFNCRISGIRYAPKTKQAIVMHTVPAESDIVEKLHWDNRYIREKDFELVLGAGLLENVVVDLNKTPHALIASVTGGGKSVLMRCLLWQSIKKGARVYMIDFKGGVEFGKEYEKYGEVFTERQDALAMLKELTRENTLRLKLFREVGVKNLAEYNEKFPDRLLCRIIVLSDEVAEMLDKTGLQAKEKNIYYALEKELSTLARLGRAPGINMILATQRPDANVIVGQIKNNLPIRISGRMTDDPASKMVLGNSEATKIDENIKGRFMYNVGADTYEFQGYLFTENSLEKGAFQRGTMLVDDPGHEDPDEEDNDFDEMLDADVPPDDDEEEFEGF